MSSPSPTTTTPTRITPSVCHRRKRLHAPLHPPAPFTPTPPPLLAYAMPAHAASGTPRKHTATRRTPPRAQRTHAAACACVSASRPHTPSASRSARGPPQRGMAASTERQRTNPQPHTEPSPRTSCVCRLYLRSSTPRTCRATHGHEDRTRRQRTQLDADDRQRVG